ALYRLGSTGKMPAGLTVKNGCVTRKALVRNALFLQFHGGSWQIANSAVSRSSCSWRFAQAGLLTVSWLLLSSAASVRASPVKSRWQNSAKWSCHVAGAASPIVLWVLPRVVCLG